MREPLAESNSLLTEPEQKQDLRRLYFAETVRDCLLAALAVLLLTFIVRASL